jgi:signal transduction histidine kinase/ligand-binding sensor domain-containing protein/DNA-binding response OmpR family regulator
MIFTNKILSTLSRLILITVGLFCNLAQAAPLSPFDSEFDLVFERITIDDGLPENSVRAIIQDRHGFVWLGTQNGLVRYDGYEMLVHAPAQDDSTSFGGRTVDALLEDADGDIWIGTFLVGLWRYDGEMGGFHRVLLGSGGDPGPLHIFDIAESRDGLLWVATRNGLYSVDPGTEVATRHEATALKNAHGRPAEMSTLLVDNQNRVWCGYEGAGVAVFEPETGRIRNYRRQADSEFTLAHDTVYGLSMDPRGRVWAATLNGLSLWRESQNSFVNFRPSDASISPSANVLTSSFMDEDGLLWIGSGIGLLVFDPDTHQFRLFEHNKDRPTSPVNGPVLCLLIDRSGVIWGGSWHTGLNKTDPSAGRFRVTEFAMRAGSSSKASAESILEDREGRLWLGLGDKPHGQGEGRLMRRDHIDGDWVEISPLSRDQRGFSAVRDLAQLSDGSVVVGTYRGVWSAVGDQVVPISETLPGLPEIFDTASVKSMAQDHQGRVWLATWTGILRWTPETGEVRAFRHAADDSFSLSSDALTTVHVDRRGTVWVAADSEGLNRYRPESEDFQRYFDPQQGLSTISDIYEATDGNLWLASFSGLVEFDPETGSTHVFGRENGLPNQQIGSIVSDDAGVLWVSTGFGVASFHPGTHEVRAFDVRDGLPDNTVKFASGGSSGGHLYFGGESGLVTFEPTRFVFSDFQPPVVITDIEVSDTSLQPGSESPLPRLAHLVESITLPHDRNDLGLDFAALDFSRPDQNRYRYRLEGVDGDWRDPGNIRKAVYTDLRPGRYTFRVKASNQDGVWNDVGASLHLQIKPPWWRTGWANTGYMMVALLVIWGAIRQITMRERMRAKLDVERTEAQKIREIDELKTRFLTNITHEFRTPLTLIKVPLQRLQSRLEGEDAESAETMVRNADRLEELIGQLLDLSRLESGRLPLNWRRGDCLTYLKEFVGGFESLTVQREITLDILAPAEPCEAWYDTDLLDKIAGNLMSNAVKHTPDGGTIRVDMHAGSIRQVGPRKTLIAGVRHQARVRDLVFTVTNSGSFIPPEERERIFDRFHQASQVGGAGVGLSLVKELTQWLGGEVSLSSDPEQGTSFTVTVPVFIDRPEGAETERLPAAGIKSDLSPDQVGADEEAADAEEAVLAGGPCVLLVEDNQDLRTFMARALAEEYEVFEAADGEEGIALAIEKIPDLILSDVMMPGLDGFELCRRLKEDERTSHVPIILLTARTGDESRHQGLRLGADDYLAKPFDAEDLWLRIRNLIDQRRKIARKYEQRLASLAPDAIPVISADDRFLVQLRDVVEENLDNQEFSVTELCNLVAMSRSQLHRKLTALTGNSARVFVRNHRLRRAAKLFEGGYGNVTEVAYAVGFLSLSYFAQSFRDLHGKSPSEYLHSCKRS